MQMTATARGEVREIPTAEARGARSLDRGKVDPILNAPEPMSITRATSRTPSTSSEECSSSAPIQARPEFNRRDGEDHRALRGPHPRPLALAMGARHRADAAHAPNYPFVGERTSRHRSYTGCRAPMVWATRARGPGAQPDSPQRVRDRPRQEGQADSARIPSRRGANSDELLRLIDSLQLTANGACQAR